MPVTRGQNNNAEAHSRFRGRNNDHKKHKDLAVGLAQGLAEGDKSQIDGVEHELNGHEEGDNVALEHEGHDAQSKEDGAENQVVVRRHHDQFSRWASTMAPRMATRIRKEVSSNG